MTGKSLFMLFLDENAFKLIQTKAITPPKTCKRCKPVITNKKEAAELLLAPVKAILFASKLAKPLICKKINTKPKDLAEIKQALQETLQEAEVKQKLNGLGIVLSASSNVSSTYLDDERKKYIKLLKKFNIKE